MKDIIESILVLLYNGALIAGCSYLVFWKGHSGWWFLLAIVLCAHKTKNTE